jgi:hypothetical protein
MKRTNNTTVLEAWEAFLFAASLFIYGFAFGVLVCRYFT